MSFQLTYNSENSKIDAMPFKPGQVANPLGAKLRYKHSGRTIKGQLERFAIRNFSPRKLQVLFDSLTARQKVEMFLSVLPFLLPRPQADNLTKEELDRLYQMLNEKANEQPLAKVG